MGKRKSEGFRKKYPNLADELGGSGTIKIQAVRSDVNVAEKVAHGQYGYEPTAVDFILRCKNAAQAREIIDFMESKEQIDSSYAKRLRSQLAKRGLKSFGKRREQGCYEHGETG